MRLVSPLALALSLASVATAAAQGGLGELPRQAGVGQPLELTGLVPPAIEEARFAGGTRTILHSYRVLYGGKTLEDGEETLVLHLSHRIELHFQPEGPAGKAAQGGGRAPMSVAVDHEVTSYQFVNPQEISIGGASLLVLSYNDSKIEFVEQ